MIDFWFLGCLEIGHDMFFKLSGLDFLWFSDMIPDNENAIKKTKRI